MTLNPDKAPAPESSTQKTAPSAVASAPLPKSVYSSENTVLDKNKLELQARSFLDGIY